MIATNKERLITLAVHGEIVPAQVNRQYEATWDGMAKLCIGVGGINYNLRVGDRVFGWASGDRAEPGVSTDNTGTAAQKAAYRTRSSLGNGVKVLTGEGKGARGVVIGKHGYRLPGGAHHVLLHFEDDDLEKLAIGDKILIRACGVGLRVEGFEDVMVRSVGPGLLENMGIEEEGGNLVVPVVKEIPHTLIGEGWGTRAHDSHIGIQTCYPPDVEAHGLNELRFGDVVILNDILSDYGRHYYRGGATVGVIVSGPSDVSGRGLGVTTILSSKAGRLAAELDPDANIGRYLGLMGG